MNVSVVECLVGATKTAETICPLLMEAMQGFHSLRGRNFRIYRASNGDEESLHFRPVTEAEVSTPTMLLLDRFSLLDLEQRYLLLADMAYIVDKFGRRA